MGAKRRKTPSKGGQAVDGSRWARNRRSMKQNRSSGGKIRRRPFSRDRERGKPAPKHAAGRTEGVQIKNDQRGRGTTGGAGRERSEEITGGKMNLPNKDTTRTREPKKSSRNDAYEVEGVDCLLVNVEG